MQASNFNMQDLFAQIQTLVDDLETERQARAVAEAAGAAKSHLLSIVSHELHAPMETIVSMADRVLAKPLGVSQRRQVETLAQSAQSLLAVLDEVLDFTKLETGEAELATERFDLHGLVRSVASEMQARGAQKGLTSGVDMGANCPRFVVGDETRVRQVLMSLIDMALQATPEGSVRLYLSVNDADDPMTVRFDVTDTSAGLSESEQERLFRPSAEAARNVGTLGLPLARRLAEAMGGEVGCDSALGQGSLYWFTFRAARAADDDTAPTADGQDGTPQGTLSGHVLVVEDNMVNRMLIGSYLDEFGLTYEMVETGAAAIMCVAARIYDLVLMDTTLPDYEGKQLTKRMRALPSPSCNVPIVALAALGASDDEQDYVADGMNARVAKPIQGRELHAALVPFLAATKGVTFAAAG